MTTTITFQGFDIVIENPVGSERHWYDPHNQTAGVTTMKYAYGYFADTLGVDGDEVDVFVGPNEAAAQVHVITQNKTPQFTEVDEQKCMLGFSSPEEAFAAYQEHYNDSRFFRSMKSFGLMEFRLKLSSSRGVLLKSLLKDIEGHATILKGKPMSNYLDDIANCVKDLVAKSLGPEQASQFEQTVTADRAAVEVEKSLKAAAVAPLARQYRIHHLAAGSAQPQPAVGTNRVRVAHEPPVVPVRRVETPPLPMTPVSIDMECIECGGLTKSQASHCSKCVSARSLSEAGPFWKR